MKKNCWEIKECGREPRGAKAKEWGICPAATKTEVNGIHGGKNGGRCCWAIAGTLCGGKVQGSFASKISTCLNCECYNQIKQEEQNFVFVTTIFDRLNKKL